MRRRKKVLLALGLLAPVAVLSERQIKKQLKRRRRNHPAVKRLLRTTVRPIAFRK